MARSFAEACGTRERLREAIASLTRRLANSLVLWDDIWALKAKKLFALDKCPGIQPIGVGDVAYIGYVQKS